MAPIQGKYALTSMRVDPDVLDKIDALAVRYYQGSRSKCLRGLLAAMVEAFPPEPIAETIEAGPTPGGSEIR